MLQKPFKTLATAVAFSPNMVANICESLRIRNMIGEKLILIHVGDREVSYEEKIRDAVRQCGEDPDNIDIVWEAGDAAEAILKVARERQVDLIIAGAQPREGLLRYYLGSVARRLVRRSDCSILLMPQPDQMKRRCRKVIVNGLQHPKTADTIRTAVIFAQLIEAAEVVIVEEVEPRQIGTRVDDDKSLAEAQAAQTAIENREHKRIENILKDIPVETGIDIRQQVIFGRKGYTIGHFAETSCADLLVMNSPDSKLGFLDRVFTHDLEYILGELPSDLLIVHSTRHKQSP